MSSHFYNPKHGDLLHHYTSQESALNIAKSGRLWLSEFTCMNDATEYHYARENYLKAYRSRQVWIDDLPRFTATTSLIGLEQNTNMLIGCFCDDPHNPILWERYAGGGAGCILSFDASHIINDLGVAVRRVVYDPTDLELFALSGLSMLQEKYEEAPDDQDALSELAKFFVADLFAFKAPSWSTEKEIRVSRMIIKQAKPDNKYIDIGGHAADLSPIKGNEVKVRNGPSGPTSYIELPFDMPGNGALRAITLGQACTSPQRAEFEKLEAVGSGRVILKSR